MKVQANASTANMSGEYHLIVLWEYALSQEEKILADVARHVEIVVSEVLAWPEEAESCFSRFYGAKLEQAAAKVQQCGGGSFRVLLVRDAHPRYGWRRTSRGHEYVNLRLFAMKMRYRRWTGGGHRIHTTNSVSESRRDVFLLTGLLPNEYAQTKRAREILPGTHGWADFRSVFSCLEACGPWVILRNAELLPDAFDPTLHGDIDILVNDASECAGVLNAKKIFPEAHRVCYELEIGGKNVQFDFRFVGDGYYDERWERDMLARRRPLTNGVRLLNPQDAYFALVYHALVQKQKIASDYAQKVHELAIAAGQTFDTFANAFLQLEDFLASHHYQYVRPTDSSVYFDTSLLTWRDITARLEGQFALKSLKPIRLESRKSASPIPMMFFEGVTNAGQPCFVKYSKVAVDTLMNEFELSARFACKAPMNSSRPYYYHGEMSGGAVVSQWIEGLTLSEFLDQNPTPSEAVTESLLKDFLAIAQGLAMAEIVHRDLRPDNLILGADGHLKLIDFQAAVDLHNQRERAIFRTHWRELLFALGEDYKPEFGVWNDRFSLLKVMELLPKVKQWGSVRDELLRDLSKFNFYPVFPKKDRWRFGAHFLNLSLKAFWARWRGRRDKTRDERTFCRNVWRGRNVR